MAQPWSDSDDEQPVRLSQPTQRKDAGLSEGQTMERTGMGCPWPIDASITARILADNRASGIPTNLELIRRQQLKELFQRKTKEEALIAVEKYNQSEPKPLFDYNGEKTMVSFLNGEVGILWVPTVNEKSISLDKKMEADSKALVNVEEKTSNPTSKYVTQLQRLRTCMDVDENAWMLPQRLETPIARQKRLVNIARNCTNIVAHDKAVKELAFLRKEKKMNDHRNHNGGQ